MSCSFGVALWATITRVNATSAWFAKPRSLPEDTLQPWETWVFIWSRRRWDDTLDVLDG